MTWSAPTPPWLYGLRGVDGKLIQAPSEHLLTYLWSRADAPSKRAPGPAFLRPRWHISLAELARRFQADQRTIERRFRALVQAGVVKRGVCVFDGVEEAGIWLADVEVGYFDVDVDESVGSLYAVEFSDGAVKIGRSAEPENRIADHVDAAACFSVRMTRRWISPVLLGVNTMEATALDRMRELCPVRRGEWFERGWDQAMAIMVALVGGAEGAS